MWSFITLPPGGIMWCAFRLPDAAEIKLIAFWKTNRKNYYPDIYNFICRERHDMGFVPITVCYMIYIYIYSTDTATSIRTITYY